MARVPSFSAGHGAAVAYRRSAKQPWAYELVYVALLYQTGNSLYYLYVAIIWIFWYSLKAIKSDVYLVTILFCPGWDYKFF